jgi:hypothetical protein
MKRFKTAIALGTLMAMVINSSVPFGVYAQTDESASGIESTDVSDTEGESVSAKIESISASDERMSTDYWAKHRIDTDKGKSTYISAYSNNGGKYSSSVLSNAFDGNWATHWETGTQNSSSFTNYVDTTFNKPVYIDRIIYATRQDGAKSKGYPTELTIYSYNGESDSWDVVATGESGVSSSYVIITLPKAIEFKKLRFEFTEAYNSWASASEFVYLCPEERAIPEGSVTISGTSAIGKELKANADVMGLSNISYQWQYSNDGKTYTNIEGATEPVYTITDSKQYYRVAISDGDGYYYSTIFSDAYSGNITASIEGSTKLGNTLTANAAYVDESENISYKWQYSENGTDFTDIADTKEYTIPVEMSNRYLRVGVSIDGESYIYSDNVFVAVNTVITGVPQVGSTLNAKLSNPTDGISYVWQRGDSADGEFKDIDGATNSSYTLTDADKDSYIRAKIVVNATGSEIISDARLVLESGSYDEFNDDMIYLSDLPDKYVLDKTVGYGSYYKDKNINSGTISLNINGNKKYFVKGIGAHAPANLIYDVSYYVENYGINHFKAYIGLDSSVGTDGNGAKFFIYTSTDNSEWKLVQSTGVLKGTSEAVNVDIDLSGVNYLKIVTNANGDNSSDHTVLADAMLCKEDYSNDTADLDFIKTVSEYDGIIQGYLNEESYSQLMNDSEFRAAVSRRTFIKRAGYELLQAYAKSDSSFRNTLEWLMNDDNIELYVMGGEPDGSYVNSINVLTKLLAAHGDDLEDASYGELYRRMMLALSLTHSQTVRYWINDVETDESPAVSKNVSDPLKRYEIYKKMFLANKLDSNFINLNIEEMRLVMNTKMSDNEIEWLRDYIYSRTNGNYFGYSSWWITYKNGDYMWFNDAFYDESTIADYSAKYGNFLDYGVNIEKYHPSLWMLYASNGICWHISNAGSNVMAAYGVPTMTLGQPAHVYYVYARPDSNGVMQWTSCYASEGWSSSRFETYTGDKGYYYQRPVNNWGLGKYQQYHTDASYLWLGERALADYDGYIKSQSLVLAAAALEGDADGQRELYRQAITANKYNFDAYWALVSSYADDTEVSDETRISLASEILNVMKDDPLPGDDLWAQLNNQITDTQNKAYMSILRSNAVAGWLSNSNSDVRNVTNLINKSEQSGRIASFSFDGENAGKLMLTDSYSGIGVYWNYSLDGGTNWTEVDGDSVQLTQAELDAITADNDIKVHIMGRDYSEDNIFTLDITTATLPKNMYANDRENKVILSTDNMEWSEDGGESWTDLTDETRFTGDRAITMRLRSTGMVLHSKESAFTFTEDDDTPQRKYVTLDRLTLTGYSSQHDSSVAAQNATDGNINTIWHTSYSKGSQTDLNRYLIYQLSEPTYLSGINYTPRQDGTNGIFLDCAVYVSDDGEDWELAGSATGWANNKTTKQLTFDSPVYASYVKIVGTRTSGDFGSASMIELFENTLLKGMTPTSIEVTSLPTKTKYLVGESLDTTGLKVTATFEDGSKSVVDLANLTIGEVDLSAEGTYTVTVAYKGNNAEFNIQVVNSDTCEAAIGNKQYLTLADAVNAAENDDTITILKDITLSKCITISKTLTLTGDENESEKITLNRGSDLTSDYMLKVTSGDLELKNIILDGGAVWTNGTNGSNSGITAVKSVIGITGGTVVLGEGAVIQNGFNDSAYASTKDSGGAVAVTGTATLKLDGGSLINNRGRHGGAVVLRENGRFIMDDGTVSGNYGSSSGGAIKADGSSTITVNGGIIENNRSTEQGGALWTSNGHCIISGGTIRDNVAKNGSILYISGSGNLILNGGDCLTGTIAMASNKTFSVYGDLKDSSIAVQYASTPANGYKVADFDDATEVYVAAQAISVAGYYSYVTEDGLYITTADLSKDVNMDGKVDSSDSAALLRYISGLEVNGFNSSRADIDGNSVIDIKDAIRLISAD